MSDGQTVWLYDEDLMQVTVKKVSDALGATPGSRSFRQRDAPEGLADIVGGGCRHAHAERASGWV